MNKKIVLALHWTPRIMAILFTAFVTLLLFDVFAENYSPLQLLAALAFHAIPTLVLIVVLILAWKNDLRGGLTFLVLGIIHVLETINNFNFNLFLIVSMPLFLIGFLFVTSSLIKKKNLKS